MLFKDFILGDAIETDIDADDKEAVIRGMVQSIVNAGGLNESDCEDIVQKILEREQLGTTALGRGFAMPHAKHPSVTRQVGAVAVSRSGVDFESLDGGKTNLFFLLLSPQDATAKHVEAMKYIALQLRDEGFCRYLQQVQNKDQVTMLLNEADAKFE